MASLPLRMRALEAYSHAQAQEIAELENQREEAARLALEKSYKSLCNLLANRLNITVERSKFREFRLVTRIGPAVHNVASIYYDEGLQFAAYESVGGPQLLVRYSPYSYHTVFNTPEPNKEGWRVVESLADLGQLLTRSDRNMVEV